ncbi:MAG: 3-oxoacyl-ACP reductase FabG [Desulfoprunum sp.]|nr:3-oxoacyl-ACP reductase FabG [Desulfoprunum sp.]
MQSFLDQIVIVTGATRGIGRAITLAFLKQGATVVGIYHNNRQAAEQFKEECHDYQKSFHLFQCDISKEEQVVAFYEEIEQRFSSIDVLINNAGVRKDAFVAMMHSSDWQSVLDINLTGSFLMAKQAVLLMMKKKYGRIINITSPVSHLGFAGQANYAASKAGQIGMTRSLAKEIAKRKITVNCISPGFIETDFLHGLSKDQIENYKSMVPMRRFGTPEEVAEAVLFIAGRNASYITGAVLDINGGL